MSKDPYDYPALRAFEDWPDALEWALGQVAAGSPKYHVRFIPEHLRTDGTDKWEAVQAWMKELW